MSQKLPPGTRVVSIIRPAVSGTIDSRQFPMKLGMKGKETWQHYVKWDDGGYGIVSQSDLKAINPQIITGYHGCSCHPFESWEECEKAHKRKFKPGQRVKVRHTGEMGSVIEKADDDPYWWKILVDPGTKQSDIRVAHSANLILGMAPHQLSLFKVNNVP